MSDPPRQAAERRWLGRVRALAHARARQQEGACFVEGIRPVLAAEEAGLPFEVVLVCPDRLRSPAAWDALGRLERRGVPRADLPARRFAQVSDMDNPVGLAAVVRWAPAVLDALHTVPGALVLIAEDVGDAGNLGTLVRAADGAGAAAVVVAGDGADPAHRRCLRASLGTVFHLPVVVTTSGVEAVRWARGRGLTAVATSSHARQDHWDVSYPAPLALVVGSEERGLRPETTAACDRAVRIPMWGTATSLNVAVAAGVLLYEVRRAWRAGDCGRAGSGVSPRAAAPGNG